MDNLISICFVVTYRDGSVDPTIYFQQPGSTDHNVIHIFDNPFEARAWLRLSIPESIEITVSKRAV